MKQILFFFLLFFSLLGVSGNSLAEEERNDNLEEVIAEGVGLTEREAQLAAIKEGVRDVIGRIIDTETVNKKKKNIEKILLSCRTYVSKQEVLSSNKDTDGIWTVRLRLLVKQTDLAGRLQSSGLQIMSFDGYSAAKQLVFEKGQAADNIRYLAHYFHDNQFPYSFIKVVLNEKIQTIDNRDKNSSTEVTSETDGGVRVVVHYQVKPDMEKFNQFRNGLNEILGKIAVRKFTIPMTLQSVEQSEDFDEKTRKHCLELCPNTMIGKISDDIPKPSQNENVLLLVFQSQSGKFKNSKWTAYELPSVFREFLIQYSCIIPVVNVSVYDTSNKVCKSKCFPLEAGEPESAYLYENLSSHTTGTGIYNFFPFFRDNAHMNYFRQIENSVVTKLIDPESVELFFLAPMSTEKCPRSSEYFCVYPSLNLNATIEMTMDELKNVGKAGIGIIHENIEMENYYEKLKAK